MKFISFNLIVCVLKHADGSLNMKYLIICGSSVVVYLIITVIIRLLGKKNLSQLSIYDLVLLLLISNAVQNMMTEPDTSFLSGLCIVGTLFIVNYLFKYIAYRFPNISKLIKRNDIMLIYNGKIHKGNLARTRISIIEIEKISAEHGIKSIDEISLAVLEVDGNISILSNDYKISFKKKMESHNDAI